MKLASSEARKQNRIRHFRRLPQPLHRMLLANQIEIPAPRLGQRNLADRIGFDGSRGDRVDPDPVLGPLDGEMLSKTGGHELGRTVRGLATLTSHS